MTTGTITESRRVSKKKPRQEQPSDQPPYGRIELQAPPEWIEELDAIAACVIGGASLMGGRGTIFGACLGALIMASLDNGMSLLNVRDFMQDIIKGSILVVAVGIDMAGKKQS